MLESVFRNSDVVRRRMFVVVLATALASFGLAPLAAQQVRLCDGLAATIVGTPGNDTLTGTHGVDVIAALQGDDVIRGLSGDDVICGGLGDDTIYGGSGFDVIFGAQGNDILYAADGASDGRRLDLRGARMFGGVGNDVIYGSNRWDRMQGGPGNDSLMGFEGRDWIRGGSDSDVVDGGVGIDDLHGGNGHDTIELTAGDVVRGGAGKDQCNFTQQPARVQSCGENHREGQAKDSVVPVEPAPSTDQIDFSYEHFGGTVWSGVMYGFVPAGFDETSDMYGECYLIVGEVTATFSKRGPTVSASEAPGFGLVAGGLMEGGQECDSSEAEALGYRSIHDFETEVGTTFRFFAEVTVVDDFGPITAMFTGDSGDGKIRLYDPVFLERIPS